MRRVDRGVVWGVVRCVVVGVDRSGFRRGEHIERQALEALVEGAERADDRRADAIDRSGLRDRERIAVLRHERVSHGDIAANEVAAGTDHDDRPFSCGSRACTNACLLRSELFHRALSLAHPRGRAGIASGTATLIGGAADRPELAFPPRHRTHAGSWCRRDSVAGDEPKAGPPAPPDRARFARLGRKLGDWTWHAWVFGRCSGAAVHFVREMFAQTGTVRKGGRSGNSKISLRRDLGPLG